MLLPNSGPMLRTLLVLLFVSAQPTKATFFGCNGPLEKALCRSLERLGYTPKFCRPAPTKPPTTAPIPAPKAPILAPVAPTSRPQQAPQTAPVPVPLVPVTQPSLITPIPPTIPIKAPTAVIAPTKAPIMTPVNTPSVRNADCFGMIYGDPHLTTFDGVSYSCQGVGEFVLYSSEPSGARVHARLDPVTPTTSIVTAIAARGDRTTSPLVELSVRRTLQTKAEFTILINGQRLVRPGDGYVSPSVTITPQSLQGFSIFFYGSGLSLFVVVNEFAIRGFFYLQVTVRRPCATTVGETIRGLLGSPDGMASNDWTTVNGSILALPPNRTGRAAFEYCTRHWCNVNTSLFVNQTQRVCNDTFPGSVNTDLAPFNLKDLCRTNEECLVDGTVFGALEPAFLVLDSQAELARFVSGRFQVSPSSILVNQSTIVTFTVNLTGINASNVGGFQLWQANGMSWRWEGILVDSALGTWDATGPVDQNMKRVFQGELPVWANSVGQVFGYKAVPTLRTTLGGFSPVASSPLAYTDTLAVRSFSIQSGVVPLLTPLLSSKPVLTAQNADTFTLYIETLASPEAAGDLILGNVCLRIATGNAECLIQGGGNQFIFTRNNPLSLSYLQATSVAIGRFFATRPLVQVTVDMLRYEFGGPGFVSLRVSIAQESTNGNIVVDRSNSLVFSIASGVPGLANIVANVVRTSNGGATIELFT